MKDKDNKKAKQVQTLAVCGCLCLAALGAGVTYRAFDRSHLEAAEQTEQAEQPVTAVKSPTIEIAALERDRQSNDPGKAPEPEEKEPAKQEAKPIFTYPLEGEVVLPYSIDHAIYDPTLEQYRTNASISIAAKTGTEVKAAADGTVQAVTVEEKTGNTVVIAHKDGWLTTYGQLKDTVNVKEGSTVKQGEAIGMVGEPAKYGAGLGSHLEFSMEQNGESKDPTKHLEKE